jgi:hypothetical protein
MTASSAHSSAGRVPPDWQQRQIVFPLHPVEARQQRIETMAGARSSSEHKSARSVGKLFVCALGIEALGALLWDVRAGAGCVRLRTV